jgi:hypothetical protein
MGRFFVAAILLLALLPVRPVVAAPADATKASAKPSNKAAPQSPDAKFDKTGDGWVDAEDWKRMTPEERAAYARASVRALGQDPDAGVGGGKTRADQYLDGLKSVYGP